MARLWSTQAHVGLGARTSNGAAPVGIRVGGYAEGQLIVHCPALATGGTVTPYWQSSADGVH